MKVEKIKELTEKLVRTGDITDREADRIVSPFEAYRSKFYESLCHESELTDAYREWYAAVKEKLPQYGNYVTTIPLVSGVNNLEPRLLFEIGECIDRALLTDKVLNISLSPHFEIPEEVCDALDYVGEKESKMYFKRAGMIERMGLRNILNSFLPVLENDAAEEYEFAMKSRSGYNFYFLNSKKLYGAIVASVIHEMDIPSIHVHLLRSLKFKGARYSALLVSPEHKGILEPALNCDVVGYVAKHKLMSEEDIRTLSSGGVVWRTSIENVVNEIKPVLVELCNNIAKKAPLPEDDEWMEVIR